MADIADYYINKEINRNINFKPKREEATWITINGDVLYVKDMTTSHLINSINKLKRDGRKMFKPLEDELRKRGIDK